MVFDDADIPSAVNGVAFAAYIASGQTCVSGTRLILDESIYNEFMAAFIDKVRAIEAGIGDRAFLPHFLTSYLRPYSLQPKVDYGNSNLPSEFAKTRGCRFQNQGKGAYRRETNGWHLGVRRVRPLSWLFLCTDRDRGY